MGAQATVTLRIAATGLEILDKTGKQFGKVAEKAGLLRQSLGSTNGVLSTLKTVVSPVSSLLQGLGGGLKWLVTSPLRLLQGGFSLVSGAFMGLVNLVKAHPIITLLGGYLAVNFIKGFTRSLLESIRVQEQAYQRVKSAVISTGEVVYDYLAEQLPAWGVYEKRIVDVTAALQRKTLYGDEAQMEALGELITVLGDTEKALETLPLVLDVAARHGLGLASASRAIGLAMKGDIGLIGRYVPALRGLSDKEKTVENITRILRETYAGTAETLARTSSGALAQLSNAWSDVEESMGAVVQDALAPTARWLTENLYRINAWIVGVHEGRATWDKFAGTVVDWLSRIASKARGFLGGLINNIQGIGEKLWASIGGGVKSLLNHAVEAFTDSIPFFIDLGGQIAAALVNAWPAFVVAAKKVWEEVYPIVTAGLNKIQEFFTAVVIPFAQAGKEWGLALAENLITEFLRFLGRHPIAPIAMGALAGGAVGGVPGAVVGAVGGMAVGAGLAGSGLEALEDIKQERAEREAERERQRKALEGLSPETREAFRRSGKFDLVPPTIEEMAPSIFGSRETPPATTMSSRVSTSETDPTLGNVLQVLEEINRKMSDRNPGSYVIVGG